MRVLFGSTVAETWLVEKHKIDDRNILYIGQKLENSGNKQTKESVNRKGLITGICSRYRDTSLGPVTLSFGRNKVFTWLSCAGCKASAYIIRPLPMWLVPGQRLFNNSWIHRRNVSTWIRDVPGTKPQLFPVCSVMEVLSRSYASVQMGADVPDVIPLHTLKTASCAYQRKKKYSSCSCIIANKTMHYVDRYDRHIRDV